MVPALNREKSLYLRGRCLKRLARWLRKVESKIKYVFFGSPCYHEISKLVTNSRHYKLTRYRSLQSKTRRTYPGEVTGQCFKKERVRIKLDSEMAAAVQHTDTAQIFQRTPRRRRLRWRWRTPNTKPLNAKRETNYDHDILRSIGYLRKKTLHIRFALPSLLSFCFERCWASRFPRQASSDVHSLCLSITLPF